MNENKNFTVAKLSAEVAYWEELDGGKILKRLEKIARLCYKSEDKIKPGSDKKLLKAIIDRGHEAMIEHEKVTVKVVCDRGVSHEWVRHRIASYAQESTRYCDYSKGKFGSGITVIEPLGMNIPGEKEEWEQAMEDANRHYQNLRAMGVPAQRARHVLPISTKTEMFITFNMREWRAFFKLRAAEPAHPHIRFLSRELFHLFKENVPVLFDDLSFPENDQD